MIIMPYGWLWPILQLTGQADFWHSTSYYALPARPILHTTYTRSTSQLHVVRRYSATALDDFGLLDPANRALQSSKGGARDSEGRY